MVPRFVQFWHYFSAQVKLDVNWMKLDWFSETDLATDRPGRPLRPLTAVHLNLAWQTEFTFFKILSSHLTSILTSRLQIVNTIPQVCHHKVLGLDHSLLGLHRLLELLVLLGDGSAPGVAMVGLYLLIFKYHNILTFFSPPPCPSSRPSVLSASLPLTDRQTASCSDLSSTAARSLSRMPPPLRWGG